MYKMKESEYRGNDYCLKDTLLIKILPIIDYINNIYIDSTEETIQKVGALYNAIEDTEL